jgi:hypothetical protein
MTTKLESVALELIDLGDAKVETRQVPVVPIYFDHMSGTGIIPT